MVLVLQFVEVLIFIFLINKVYYLLLFIYFLIAGYYTNTITNSCDLCYITCLTCFDSSASYDKCLSC